MQNIAYERGGWCLSPDYSDSKTKLWWQCGEGHIWDTTPGQIKNSKSWCLTCYKIKKRVKGLLSHVGEVKYRFYLIVVLPGEK
ncbi:MAG: hypothetical protein JSV67_02945 [Thermoplasmatales archaeon]|nr:MAG: hypothetical protein JSV67_02945 [Thermoplasmatales archaeon]